MTQAQAVAVALCFRLLASAQGSAAVHATAAATLRQGTSALLERAGEEEGLVPALQLLHELLRVAGDLEQAPLPRAFALDLLDAGLGGHARLFAAQAPLANLLAERLVPLLLAQVAAPSAQQQPPSSPLQPQAEEIGVDPALVALTRVACRAAAGVARGFCAALPAQARLLLAGLQDAAESPAAPAWCRVAALEALRACAADARLAQRLADATVEDGVALLQRTATLCARILAEACGTGVPPDGAAAAMTGLEAWAEARAGERGQEPPSPADAEDDEAQRAHAACLALACVAAQCSAAEVLSGDAGACAAAVGASAEPLCSALHLLLSLAQGDALAKEVLGALCALMGAATAAGADGARDSLLYLLCTHAAAGAELPTPSLPPDAPPGGETPRTPGARGTRTSFVAAGAPTMVNVPTSQHCARALLTALPRLAPVLGVTGWRMVMEALSRIDGGLEADRAGAGPGGAAVPGQRAALAQALAAFWADAAQLADGVQDALLGALQGASAREVGDAEAAAAVSATALGARRASDGRHLFLLSRHAGLLLAGPRRLAALWPGLQAHAARAASSAAPAARREALAALGGGVLGALSLPREALEGGAAAAAAAAAGQPSFAQLLVDSLRQAAPPDAPLDAREAALGALRDVTQRLGERLGEAWGPVLAHLAGCAAAADEGGTGLVPSGFAAAAELAQHSLPCLPAALHGQVVLLLEAFCSQQADLNASLASVSLLWDVADYAAREGAAAAQRVLPAAFASLARVAGDPRPEVRNSAVRVLSAALATHAPRLPLPLARAAVWAALLPCVALAANEAQVARASAAPAPPGPPGPARGNAPPLLLHHSRDSAAKQWDETVVLGLGGLARAVRAQAQGLAAGEDFAARWASVAQLLERAACGPSREVATSAMAGLAALTGSGALGGASWARALEAYERVARDAEGLAARAEAPASLLRLYGGSMRGAFGAEDVALLLRVADAAARSSPPPTPGELHPLHRVALELARAMPPFEPRVAAGGAHQALLRWLARLLADASGDTQPRPPPELGTQAAELLGAMYGDAPARVRAECLSDVAAAAAAAAHTRRLAPGAPLWRAGVAALAQLLRAGPAALGECAPQLGAAGWQALACSAASLLPGPAGALGLLDAIAGDASSAREDATALAADEKALGAALDALCGGALAGGAAATAPASALAELVTLLQAGAAVAEHGAEGASSSTAQRLALACMRHLSALSAPQEERASRVAVLALPAFLQHCRALLERCAAADGAGGEGAPARLRDALVCALEAAAALRPGVHAVDAAAMQAPATEAAQRLLPLLRASRGRGEQAHALLIYAPLVAAIHARDVRVRSAVAGACLRACLRVCAGPDSARSRRAAEEGRASSGAHRVIRQCKWKHTYPSARSVDVSVALPSSPFLLSSTLY